MGAHAYAPVAVGDHRVLGTIGGTPPICLSAVRRAPLAWRQSPRMLAHCPVRRVSTSNRTDGMDGGVRRHGIRRGTRSLRRDRFSTGGLRLVGGVRLGAGV